MNKGADVIALFVPTLGGGGAERNMAIIANSLAARGFLVELVLIEAKGPHIENISDKVNIVDLDAGRAALSLWPLVKYLRLRKPIALLSTMDRANVIAILARVVSRVRTRVVVRIPAPLSRTFTSRSIRSRLLIRPLLKWAYRRADAVVTVSRGVLSDAKKFLKLPDHKLTVINNPILFQDILERSRESLDGLRCELLPPPVILGAGRLVQEKDFSTLIKAFEIVSRNTDVRLLILGEGPERPKLEDLIADLNLTGLVSMPGFVSNPYAYMAKASLFVLSSKSEGFPNALIEAMALGTPVVSTDCMAGPNEILDGGRYGELVPVGNPQALSRAILRELAKGPGPRINLQTRVKELCGLDSIIKKYIDILLGRANPR